MTTQQTKDSKEPHIHDFAELVEKVVPLRKYVTEHGKSIPDIMTGKDILSTEKQKWAKELLEEAVPNPTTPAGELEFVPVSVIEAYIGGDDAVLL